MFSFLTSVLTLQDRANLANDSNAATIVDSCIHLWTRMLIADTVHDNKIVENVQLLQEDCTSMLNELRQCLSKDREARKTSVPPDSGRYGKHRAFILSKVFDFCFSILQRQFKKSESNRRAAKNNGWYGSKEYSRGRDLSIAKTHARNDPKSKI